MSTWTSNKWGTNRISFLSWTTGGLVVIGASIWVVSKAIQAGALNSPECLLLLALYSVFLAHFGLALQRNQRPKALPSRDQIPRLKPESAVRWSHARVGGISSPRTPECPPVTEREVSAFLERPPSEQGHLLGALRRRQMTGTIELPDEKRNQMLAATIREKLELLEKNPAAFAEFQSSFIEAAIELVDERKVSQIREIIQKTYEEAVTKGLDASARPTEGVESWALRRDALDRPATRQVEAIFTPEERGRFGRAFLGVMGIDLGLHDGARHRFVTPEGGVIFPSEYS